MLTVYNPATGTTQTTQGNDLSDQLLLLNILIEQRVTNALLMDMQRALVTETQAQYRNDIVNAVVNPGT